MNVGGAGEWSFPLLAAALKGEQLTGVERALDMAMFSFGPDVPWVDAFSDRRVRPRFGLHVQCPFRLAYEGKVILDDRDMRHAIAGDTRSRFLRTDWEDEGEPTVFDGKARSLNSILEHDSPVVLSVEMDWSGDLSLSLSQDLRINVMPPRKPTGEAWRLFETMGSHVVFPFDFPADDRQVDHPE